MLYSFIRPLLFSLDPETAHELTLSVARLSPSLGELTGLRPDPNHALKLGKLEWSFPVGLAAGLDKNAEALDFFSLQGFGSIECGSITLKAQAGNPRPRIFRYPEEQSLRNAMGFPNEGLASILPRLRAYKGATPIGINIGKNKDSSPDESIEELTLLLQSLEGVADYFAVNVSSPNTPGLRALQERGYLAELFTELNQHRQGKDLYLKIAPDLDESKVKELAALASEFKLTGLIATNTTIMPERGIGGISGRLLRERAKNIRQIILSDSFPLELIGVGGISEMDDLFDLWMEGGKAAQVYTAYVYQGPDLLKKIQRELRKFLTQQALPNLNSFFTLPLSERQLRLKDYRGQ